jgi:hypothetical protein
LKARNEEQRMEATSTIEQKQSGTAVRYFYPDPLAPAWMARHFGMTFDLVEWQPDKFYIHPDSLPLLNVQYGDVIQMTVRPNGITPTTLVMTNSEGTIYMNNGLSGSMFNERTFTFADGGWQIIQRNGIAFIWPERESNCE